jgi:hypothetical protein
MSGEENPAFITDWRGRRAGHGAGDWDWEWDGVRAVSGHLHGRHHITLTSTSNTPGVADLNIH